MAGKVGHLRIFGYNFTFVLRHRYEKKKDEKDVWDTLMEWREWELGFWFRRFRVVGSKNFHNPNKWKNNLVYEYMFGVNFLWGKAWFTVQRGAMVINIDNQNSRCSTGHRHDNNNDDEDNKEEYDYLINKKERDKKREEEFQEWLKKLDEDIESEKNSSNN